MCGCFLELISNYIEQLQSQILQLGGQQLPPTPPTTTEQNENATADIPMKEETTQENNEPMVDSSTFPPLYTSTSTSSSTSPGEGDNDDYDKAMTCKEKASDLKAQGKWEQALEYYTAAVLAAPPSALLYANRADCLRHLQQYHAAERDCTEALRMNPDSAKAFKIRGMVRKQLGRYTDALSDLSQAQTIDFDPDIVEDLKFLTEKHIEQEKWEAQQRLEKEQQQRMRRNQQQYPHSHQNPYWEYHRVCWSSYYDYY